MSAAALQLDLDLVPPRRPSLRAVGTAPEVALATGPAGIAPSGDIGPVGGRLTLDDVLVGVWEGLLARRTVACPACGSLAMAPTDRGGGSCRSCGSRLD